MMPRSHARFHSARHEPVLDCDVVPHLDDNTQLSVEQYRDRLYSDIAEKGARKRQVDREEGNGETTPTGGEATPTADRGGGVKSGDHTPTRTKQVLIIEIKHWLAESTSFSSLISTLT